MPVEIKLGDVGFNHPGPRPVDEPRCPYCGYTEEDKRTLMDHHICDARNGPLPDPTVCEHGGLKRKCRVCELEAENADLRKELKNWKKGASAEAFLGDEARNEVTDRDREIAELKAALAETVNFLDRMANFIGEYPPFDEDCREAARLVSKHRKEV